MVIGDTLSWKDKEEEREGEKQGKETRRRRTMGQLRIEQLIIHNWTIGQLIIRQSVN